MRVLRNVVKSCSMPCPRGAHQFWGPGRLSGRGPTDVDWDGDGVRAARSREHPPVSAELGGTVRSPRSIALVAALVLTIPIGVLPATMTVSAAAAILPPAADRMPGDVPTKKTPWVLDGEVSKIVQVGNTMIAGGLFTQVTDPMNGTPYTRQNLFAFDATTGLVSQTFNPTVDGQVQQLMPGPTADTVYVAGDFTKINNKGPNHIQLLNVTTGQAVTSFKAPSTNGGIETMELLPGNRLFIGGFFTKIASVNH